MKKYKYIFACVLIFVICIVCVSILKKDTKTIETSSSVLSNKKIGWGIKRNDNHEQPDLGKQNKEILEKYDGIAMGNSDKKFVYLTFDEGYEAGYTGKILDTLKENNVPAAFFITGHYLNTASDLVKRMIDEGHIVGNHTVNHHSIPSLTAEELKKEIMGLHQSVYEKFNYEMYFARPPKGEYSNDSLKVINELGYKTVMWSFAYEDWDEKKQPSIENAKEKILTNIHNGEIMLLHATSKTNAEILSNIIKEIKQMGYEFRSLDSFE